jgi:hypothetical protein
LRLRLIIAKASDLALSLGREAEHLRDGASDIGQKGRNYAQCVRHTVHDRNVPANLLHPDQNAMQTPGRVVQIDLCHVETLADADDRNDRPTAEIIRPARRLTIEGTIQL